MNDINFLTEKKTIDHRYNNIRKKPNDYLNNNTEFLVEVYKDKITTEINFKNISKKIENIDIDLQLGILIACLINLNYRCWLQQSNRCRRKFIQSIFRYSTLFLNFNFNCCFIFIFGNVLESNKIYKFTEYRSKIKKYRD